MAAPNLFRFATKELSQDAFICWLASWADPSCRDIDGPLHQTATEFLARLLEVGKGPKVSACTSVCIRKQVSDIDVLLIVNGDTAIIIEDKTNTSNHSNQLQKYRKIVGKMFAQSRIAAVYFKTGDQCDYSSVEVAGYGCFLRRDFLEILEKGLALGVENDIFTDFHRHLQSIDDAVQSFATTPPKDWNSKQWVGFFSVLRDKLGNGDWAKRGHGGGGSWTFRWHESDEKYLRVKGNELAFCLHAEDETDLVAKWDEWNQKLLAKNGTYGLKLRTARRKPGKRMTVATLVGDYRQLDEAGLLNLNLTIGILRNADAYMDGALASG